MNETASGSGRPGPGSAGAAAAVMAGGGGLRRLARVGRGPCGEPPAPCGLLREGSRCISAQRPPEDNAGPPLGLFPQGTRWKVDAFSSQRYDCGFRGATATG